MKIPVNEAIVAGDWLEYSDKSDDEVIFRLRLLSFEKILTSSIDNPDNMEIALDEGCLWLLKIELKNLSKTLLSPLLLQYRISLHDQDDFVFDALRDKHLTEDSWFSVQTGLIRISDGGCSLFPKNTVLGAIAFLLPDDSQAEYFISTKIGSIQAV